MMMREFPSGGLNQPQMIDHIRFISKALFQQQKRTISPSTHPYTHNKNTSPSERRTYQQELGTSECLDRQYYRIKHLATETKQKKKKMPIFQDIGHLLQTMNKNEQKQSIPITQKISKRVYGKFKQQHAQTRNKVEQKQKEQQLWNDFLNRQSQWLSEKKRMLLQVKLAEMSLRINLSNNGRSHRTKTSWDNSPKRSQSKYFKEMNKTINKIRDDTQRLRMKVLGLASRSSSKQSKQSRQAKRFIKTFQYLRK